jgi:hypothetical protein
VRFEFLTQNIRHCLLTRLLAIFLQVQVTPGQPPVSVQHLQLCGDEWSAEVAGQRLRGQALLHSHAGEQVLSLWLQGKCHEFRWEV